MTQKKTIKMRINNNKLNTKIITIIYKKIYPELFNLKYFIDSFKKLSKAMVIRMKNYQYIFVIKLDYMKKRSLNLKRKSFIFPDMQVIKILTSNKNYKF
jgi:hypothetical protein